MSGDLVSVPAKLLGLLDAYTEGSAAYTLSELSRRTGLPLTTAHRLVGELQRWGGLERGEDGRYLPPAPVKCPGPLQCDGPRDTRVERVSRGPLEPASGGPVACR
jgi:hypothetical protein